MPHSGDIIKTETVEGVTYGVSIDDVRSVLGAASRDLGNLCRSSLINKWARYKPVVSPSLLPLTFAQISNAKFGLVPRLNTVLYGKSDTSDSGASKVADSEELEEVFAANGQWDYSQPTGTTASPFRLSDFAQPADNDSAYGYYHKTPPPVDNVRTMTVNLSDVKACADNTDITTSGSYAEWLLEDNNATPLYSNLAFRFGEDTAYNVNGADVRVIPLPYLLGYGDDDDECWRMAVAVQVPQLGAGGDFELSFMRLFTSKSTFYAAQTVSTSLKARRLMPCMGTNQYLCQLIVDYAAHLRGTVNNDPLGNTRLTIDSPTFTLPACLCVVKNVYMDAGSRGDGTTFTHCHLTSESEVYSAPALLTRFNIVVNDNYDFDDDDIKAYAYLSISIVSTGQYTDFGTGETYKRQYIKQLQLLQTKAVTQNMTIAYSVECVYVTGYNGGVAVTNTITLTGRVTITSGETLSRVLFAAPGLQITDKSQTLIT